MVNNKAEENNYNYIESIDSNTSTESGAQTSEEYDAYCKHYSQSGFWNKLTKHYKSVSITLLDSVISLYYSLRDDDTPKWAKRTIIGALGYFIFPVDILPDFVPVIGFADDAAVILSALATVALYVKPIHRKKSKEKINKFFKL